jgi:transcriptional regulator of acetoin/glycerol metabolism
MSPREHWAGVAECAYLRVPLERHGQNLADAAKRAGIARGHIYRRMRRYPS